MSVKYGISEGITENQIQELITYSNSDPLIVKFTHDPKRFKNIGSFKKWKAEKAIYSLSDNTKRLLGIAWFDKKIHPGAKKCPFTFAVRIYPPARGKGLSAFLMKSSFDKFIKSEVYKNSAEKGFWLLTRKENEFALKLYSNFGFKKKTTDIKKYILMTYLA